MRKSTKILTIVLVAVMLFAVAAVAISAASPTYTKPAAATAASCGNARDFESTGAYANVGYFVSSKVTLGDNTYNRITNQQADGSFNYSTKNKMNDLPNPYLTVLEREYITMELDIMADKYTDGTTLISIEDYNKLSETAKEAYRPAFAESWIYWETEGGAWNFGAAQSVHIRPIDGKWYLCSGSGTTKTYPLTDEAGIWTHLTFVVKVGNTTTYLDANGNEQTCSYAEYKKMNLPADRFVKVATSETECHLYVDGEYAFKVDGFAPSSDMTNPAATPKFKYGQMKTMHDTSTKITVPVSFGLDNLQVYWYADGYNGPLAESVANRSSIRYNTDTVFNVDYPYPDGYYTAASVTYMDGSVYKFYDYEAAVRAITEGCIITLYDDATVAYNPNCEFLVDTNGYEFKLSAEATYLMEYAGEGTYYEVRKATEADYGTIVWEDGKGTVSKVINGITPVYPEKIDVVRSGKSAKMISGWTTNPNAVVAENNIKAVAGQTTTLYPVYSKVAFATYDENGDLIKGYGNASEILDVVNKTQIGYLFIRLYSDIDIDSFGIGGAIAPFTVNDIDLTIDLNGYRMTRFDNCGAASADVKTNLFSIATDVHTNIYIYSSREGGEIAAATRMKNGKHGGSALFHNSSRYANFTLGDGTQNLSILVPNLIWNNAYQGASLNMPNKLTINGGMYTAIHGQSDGFIVSRYGSLVFDIKNATLVTYGTWSSDDGYCISLFSGYHNSNEGYIGQINGTVDNCKIRTRVLWYATTSNTNYDNVITFTNTDIITVASSSFSQSVLPNGKMVFGENVRISNPALIGHASVEIAEGCAGLAVEDKFSVTSYRYNLVHELASDGNYYATDASRNTKVAYNFVDTKSVYTVYGPDSMVKVQWYDANKILIKETYTLVGLTAEFGGDTSTLTGERINEYLVYGFKGWKNINGTDSMIVTPGATNIFIADCTGDPVADIEASYNLATNTNFSFLFYLPVVDGVEINGVTVNGVAATLEGVSVNGVNYQRSIFTPSAADVGEFAHVVTFTYDGVTYTQSFDLSMYNYFATILKGNYASVEKQLIATALKYCNSVYEYVNGQTHADYDELLAEYAVYVKWVSSGTLRADAEMDLDAISEYVTEAVFAIGNAYKPMFGFKVAAGVTEVTFTNTSVTDGEEKSYTVTAGADYENGVLAYTEDYVPVYDIRETITVTIGGGSGTFNLAAYIVYLQTQEMTDANVAAINLCKAIYAYSIASFEYKNA